ncbi:hypothetical protein ACQY0O_005528 [Thecaphora frezii]
MPHPTLLPLLVLLVVVACASPAAAFGSGQVSEASGVFGRNFLHGDVEGILTELVKTTAGAGILGAIFSGAKQSGKKFTKDDVARVYFGNWLRDLSQAVDVAALKLMPAQRIVNVVAVLGFLEFGYATREFEVTPERLGNYLTVEHIDNPTGYPDDKGSDPRQVANYPNLRGPLDPRELEIDERNGMKSYIASENQGFDTAARFIKDNIVRAIELGRSGKRNERDEWESLRLLGTALHTLEDFAAHSNFIEVALVKLGYDRVFVHVGDRVRVRSPSGREVPPIVTGSFGGADFMHSMLGTAEDKLSQNSAQDVSSKFNDNRGKDSSALRTVLKLFLSKDEGNNDRDGGDDDERRNNRSNTQKDPDGQVDRLEELRRRASEMNPTDVSEDDVHKFLMDVLEIHDDISRTVSAIIDRIPGLDELLEDVSNNLSVFVFSTLEPVMAPIFSKVTEALFEASAAVVDNHDQTIVFNDPDASDPTHSMLAKDHFSNILNAPAGRLAQIIVRHTVKAVVEAWDDDGVDPRRVADEVVMALHHPDFVERPNAVQEEMLRFVDTWINSHGNEKDEVLRRLEKDAVLEHRNNTDGISGGKTIAAADANANKYAAASQGLSGLVKPGGILSDAPGADVVAGVLNTLNLDGNKNEQHRPQQQQQQYGGQGGRQDRYDDDDNRRNDDGGNRYGQGQQQYGQQYGKQHGQQRFEQPDEYGGDRYSEQRRNDDDDDDNRRRHEQGRQYGQQNVEQRNEYGEERRYGGEERQQQQHRRRPSQEEGGRFGQEERYGNNDEERNAYGYGSSQGQGQGQGGGYNSGYGRNEGGGYGGGGGHRFGDEERRNEFGGSGDDDNGRRHQGFGGDEFGGRREYGRGGGDDEGGRRNEYGNDERREYGGGGGYGNDYGRRGDEY